MTSFAEIHSACETRFKTQIEQTYGIQVQYDNAKFKLDESSPLAEGVWCRVTIRPGESNLVERGNTKNYRTHGVMIVEVFTELETGKGDVLAMVDIIKTAFRSVTASGVTFKTPYSTGGRRDDKWWKDVVYCPFYSDDITIG